MTSRQNARNIAELSEELRKLRSRILTLETDATNDAQPILVLSKALDRVTAENADLKIQLTSTRANGLRIIPLIKSFRSYQQANRELYPDGGSLKYAKSVIDTYFMN
jgi:hypothetical protein